MKQGQIAAWKIEIFHHPLMIDINTQNAPEQANKSIIKTKSVSTLIQTVLRVH